MGIYWSAFTSNTQQNIESAVNAHMVKMSAYQFSHTLLGLSEMQVKYACLSVETQRNIRNCLKHSHFGKNRSDMNAWERSHITLA